MQSKGQTQCKAQHVLVECKSKMFMSYSPMWTILRPRKVIRKGSLWDVFWCPLDLNGKFMEGKFGAGVVLLVVKLSSSSSSLSRPPTPQDGWSVGV